MPGRFGCREHGQHVEAGLQTRLRLMFMNSLRGKLILAFIIATLMPLGATIWITTSLLERSLGYATTEELNRLSRTLKGRSGSSTSASATRSNGKRSTAGSLRPPISLPT